jgi:glyoxylase I family protein
MRSSGVHHVDLVVSSIERSLPFYRDLLGPLGWHGVSGGAPYDRYRVGLHHLALEAGSRHVVNERADWLREQGAEIESGPEEYWYQPGYYAVFFYDPDGIKLEIVNIPGLAA